MEQAVFLFLRGLQDAWAVLYPHGFLLSCLCIAVYLTLLGMDRPHPPGLGSALLQSSSLLPDSTCEANERCFSTTTSSHPPKLFL